MLQLLSIILLFRLILKAEMISRSTEIEELIPIIINILFCNNQENRNLSKLSYTEKSHIWSKQRTAASEIIPQAIKYLRQAKPIGEGYSSVVINQMI